MKCKHNSIESYWVTSISKNISAISRLYIRRGKF